jgi:SPX domain protein involved in polyphosphate accumulation
MSRQTVDELREELKHFRFERKFYIPELCSPEVESYIRRNPAFFREVFYPRQINNIYLDSNSLKSYFDNVDGLSKRVKVRIRWYGNLFGTIREPVLEFKIKNGLLGRKESFPLPEFSLGTDFTHQTLSKIFNKSDIPEEKRQHLKLLKPVLLNCYRRKYFQTLNKQYRVTLDSNLSFYQINAQNNTFLNKRIDKTPVLELKYESYLNNADNISKYFPFRMTKMSKYVTGIDMVY